MADGCATTAAGHAQIQDQTVALPLAGFSVQPAKVTTAGTAAARRRPRLLRVGMPRSGLRSGLRSAKSVQLAIVWSLQQMVEILDGVATAAATYEVACQGLQILA